MFDRLLTLISEEDFLKIKKTHILLVGLGGVGGYILESLVRSGFQEFSLIDGDIVDISNLNRQIIAKNDNLGYSKVLEAKKRALSINKDVKIEAIEVFLDKDNFRKYVNKKYDYIIDACDDVMIKLELIKYAKENNIKIISCLGTGRRIDATKVEVTTLVKTKGCPLAKKLRYVLRKEGIDLNIPVVYSTEEAKKTQGVVGSCVFVPACAGIYIANYVFKDIINKN